MMAIHRTVRVQFLRGDITEHKGTSVGEPVVKERVLQVPVRNGSASNYYNIDQLRMWSVDREEIYTDERE